MNLKRTILAATLLMVSTIPSFAQRAPFGPGFGQRIFITDTFTRAIAGPDHWRTAGTESDGKPG